MFLGDILPSNLVIVARLFFALVGACFAFGGQLHYALVCLMLSAIINVFAVQLTGNFEQEDKVLAYTMEIDALSDFAGYGLIPATILLNLAQASLWSVILAALYLLSVANRVAHFNRPMEYQGDREGHDWLNLSSRFGNEGYQGIPLMASSLILPLFSLLAYLLGRPFYLYLTAILLLLLAIAYSLNCFIPRIKDNFLLYAVFGEMVLILLFIFFGAF